MSASIGGSGGVGVGASVGGKGGVGAGVGASVGGRNGVSAGVGASVGGSSGVSAGLGASVGGKSGIGIGAGVGLGGTGVRAGVGIGGGTTTPGKPGSSTNPNAPRLASLVSGMSSTQLAKYRIRCRDVLKGQGNYDQTLRELCLMISSAAR